MTDADSQDLSAAVSIALAEDSRITFGLVFGSTARGVAHGGSDLDVAVAFSPGAEPTRHEIGALAARIERATGRPADVVLLDAAPPGLAYRVFRDGTVVLDRDHAALVATKARAIVEYLDFLPVERACAEGVLAARSR